MTATLPPTIPMSPNREELKREALGLVNEIRAARGLPTLAELPVGDPATSRTCALARALDVWSVVPEGVDGVGYFRLEENGWRFDLPRRLCEFATDFDLGKYPELIESPELVGL